APAPPCIDTLSLHDALPISLAHCAQHQKLLTKSCYEARRARALRRFSARRSSSLMPPQTPESWPVSMAHCKHTSCTGQEVCLQRSEEHTSELQSRFDLVCRL